MTDSPLDDLCDEMGIGKRVPGPMGSVGGQARIDRPDYRHAGTDQRPAWAINDISDALIRNAADKYASEAECYITEAMGITRSEAIKRALQGRITCEIQTDGSEIYMLDAVPFLRMGKLLIEERKPSDPEVVAFTCSRTMEQLPRPAAGSPSPTP